MVKVHTRVYKQDGTLVAEFKRTVLVPRSPEAIEGGASAAEGRSSRRVAEARAADVG